MACRGNRSSYNKGCRCALCAEASRAYGRSRPPQPYQPKVRAPRTCEACGAEFQPPVRRGRVPRFCSHQCSRAAWRESHPAPKVSVEGICRGCQEPFTRSHGKQAYCSKVCRGQAAWRRMSPETRERKRAATNAWKDRNNYNGSEAHVHAQRAWWFSRGYLAQVNRRVDRAIGTFEMTTGIPVHEGGPT